MGSERTAIIAACQRGVTRQVHRNAGFGENRGRDDKEIRDQSPDPFFAPSRGQERQRLARDAVLLADRSSTSEYPAGDLYVGSDRLIGWQTSAERVNPGGHVNRRDGLMTGMTPFLLLRSPATVDIVFANVRRLSAPVGLSASPAAGENSQPRHHDRSRTRWLRNTGRWQRQSVGRGEGVQSRNVAARHGRAADALIEVRRQVGEVGGVDQAIEIGVAEQGIHHFDLAGRQAGDHAVGPVGISDAIEKAIGGRLCSGGNDARAVPSAFVVAGLDVAGNGRNRISELCVHWQRLYMAVKGNNNGVKAVGVQLPPSVRQELSRHNIGTHLSNNGTGSTNTKSTRSTAVGIRGFITTTVRFHFPRATPGSIVTIRRGRCSTSPQGSASSPPASPPMQSSPRNFGKFRR